MSGSQTNDPPHFPVGSLSGKVDVLVSLDSHLDPEVVSICDEPARCFTLLSLRSIDVLRVEASTILLNMLFPERTTQEERQDGEIHTVYKTHAVHVPLDKE